MSKSQFVAALDSVQTELTAYLKPLGFRKKGRTYNRGVGDGLVQTVNLQMGQYPIGDYVIPGLRESLYGRFAVNLGIALPAVGVVEYDRSLPPFVQECQCHVRVRLSRLVFDEDVWFDLDHLVDRTAKDVVRHMDAAGVPFLRRFESYSAVLAEIDSAGCLPGSNDGRSALVGAMICFHLGNKDRARTYFDRAADLAKDHKGFAGHVADVRRDCGFSP
ncbi:MAG: DUF4304 domain-containing protein [Steroidobacteraceae bacterium]|jgi:hypothetical protein